MKSQEVRFQKSQLLSSLAGSLPRTEAVTGVTYPVIEIKRIAIECYYRPPPWSSLCEQFLRFSKKITFCDFTAFFSFLTQANFCFLDVLIKEY